MWALTTLDFQHGSRWLILLAGEHLRCSVFTFLLVEFRVRVEFIFFVSLGFLLGALIL